MDDYNFIWVKALITQCLKISQKIEFSTTVFWPFNIIELSLIRQVPMPKTFKKVHLRSAADVV